MCQRLRQDPRKEHTEGCRRGGSAGGAAARSPTPRTAEAASEVAGRQRKALYASEIFSQPGKTVRTREIRSALNVEAIRKDVNTLYIW